MSGNYILDSRTYGWGSKEWILKKAIEHAPEENKNITLQALVSALNSQQAVSIDGLLNIIAQGTLTGMFIHTVDPTRYQPEPETEEPIYDVADAEATQWNTPENDSTGRDPLTKLTEAEIDKFIREADYLLGEDAEDPNKDWKIDDPR